MGGRLLLRGISSILPVWGGTASGMVTQRIDPVTVVSPVASGLHV